MADALIGIGADLTALREALQDIPGLAGKEADNAIRKIQRISIKASKGVSKAIREQARENARAQKAAERAARAAAREAERQAAEAREAAKGLAELAGVSADRFDKLRAVMAGLSTPAGQLAVAATGAALAFGGLATGIVGAGAAVVSLTRNARDLLEEVAPLQAALGISSQTTDRIHAANDAIDAAVASAKGLAIQLADRVAPAVERTAVVLVKLGLAAADALGAAGSAADAVGSVFGALGKAIIAALSPSLSLLLDFVEVTKTIARATGFDALADSIDGVQARLRSLPLDVVEVGFEGVEHVTRDYDKAARELIGTVTELREAEEDRGQNLKRSKADRDGAAERQAAKAAKAAEEAVRAYTSALEAARQPFVDRSELAQLQRLQASLVATAAATELSKQQTDELTAALSAIAGRIEEIQTEPLRDFEGMLRDAIAAAEAIEVDVDIDIGKMTRKALIGRAKEIGQQAASAIGTLTGGALSALASPAQLFEAATGGAKAGRQMAKDAVSFVESLAKNVGPFIRAIADATPEIITALAKATPKILIELLRSVDDIAIGIVKGVAQGVVVLVRTLARQIRRVVREVIGLDGGGRRRNRRRRRRVSDTPGPVRIDRETSMTFAPGDRVVAARTNAGLRAQVGGPASGPVEVRTVLDVRDGPVRLGLAVATNRELARSGVGQNHTGRHGVYSGTR